ncbi:MAG: DUF1343 domain-containing protein [Acidimicrobiales bacterium]|nr:DUF1343 domain-containing protein [Acidimicrobiales bacterium]
MQRAAVIAIMALVLCACVVSDPDVESVGEAVVPAPLDDAVNPSTSLTPTTLITTTVTTSPPTQTETLLNELAARSAQPTRVGLVAHLASRHPEGRTIDLIHQDERLELAVIFAPEHGLTGTADAGELLEDGFESVTGVPVLSLYGARRAPRLDDLAALDVVVYDLQDVGVRAYTYIATLGLVMEAAGRAGVPVVVVDRSNPQGAVVDGPVLADGLESFISPYPIPAAYGLTSGELARMVAKESWIDGTVDLTVIGPTAELNNPWIPPSPNLPTLESTWLYPALVAFEATTLSVGRGTDEPFTVIGGPGVDVDRIMSGKDNRQLLGLDLTATNFVPRSIEGMAKNPKHEGTELRGIHFSTGAPLPEPLRVAVELLDAFMDASPDRAALIDRPDVFDRLIGSPQIREALLADTAPSDIAELWENDVTDFRRLSDTYRN